MDWETPVTLLLWLIFGSAALAMLAVAVFFTIVWGGGLYMMHKERRLQRARARGGR